ncbi:response regulator transcription factor [Clostridium sp. D2Q-14]|nr:response regulator transcription factor [Anaeromonas gelatinilytica]
MSELLARLRVSLRHSSKLLNKQNNSIDNFILGDLKIELEKRVVSIRGQEIHLTPIEYKLLTLLAQHAGKVLTHNFIMKEVWGLTIGNETQSLRVFMASLRRKIEDEPAQPRYILTEIGVGYRMVDE